MKKIYFIIFITVLTLINTGCINDEKRLEVNEINEIAIQANPIKYKKTLTMYDGSKIDVIIIDKGVVYPNITDEYFERITSGYVTLPTGFKPSLKFKTIILEEISGHEKKMMEAKGFHMYYDEDRATQYESEWGKVGAERWYNYLVGLGIDPLLPEEEQNKLLQKIHKENERLVNLTGKDL